MKRAITICFFFFALTSLFSQTVIQMEKEGGVYKIPCVVNGLRMKFIFDTGAASVCISEMMANYMFENEYLYQEDILGSGLSSVADGRIVDHVKINIRRLEVGGKTLVNVPAIVVASQTAPLLLGQSALEQIGKISINGSTLIISDGLTDRNLDMLKDRAQKAQKNSDFSLAAAYWEEYYEAAYQEGKPSESNDFCNIADCYYWAGEWRTAIKWYEKVMNHEAKIENEVNVPLFDYRLGDCYFRISNYVKAQRLYEAAAYWYGKENDVINEANALYDNARAYHNLKNNEKAKLNIFVAINRYVEYKYPTISARYNSLTQKENFVGFMSRCAFPIDKTLSDYVLLYAKEELILRNDVACNVFKLAADLGGEEAKREYLNLQRQGLCY